MDACEQGRPQHRWPLRLFGSLNLDGCLQPISLQGRWLFGNSGWSEWIWTIGQGW